MKTAEHFKDLWRLAKEKGFIEASRYDIKTTRERHPILVDMADDFLHNDNSIFSPEPQVYIRGRGWCSADFARGRGLISNDTFKTAYKNKK